jgi:hypothetical protein
MRVMPWMESTNFYTSWTRLPDPPHVKVGDHMHLFALLSSFFLSFSIAPVWWWRSLGCCVHVHKSISGREFRRCSPRFSVDGVPQMVNCRQLNIAIFNRVLLPKLTEISLPHCRVIADSRTAQNEDLFCSLFLIKSKSFHIFVKILWLCFSTSIYYHILT